MIGIYISVWSSLPFPPLSAATATADDDVQAVANHQRGRTRPSIVVDTKSRVYVIGLLYYARAFLNSDTIFVIYCPFLGFLPSKPSRATIKENFHRDKLFS